MDCLRTTSTLIKDKHIIKQLNDMLIDATIIYDQTIYYYRQEYFRVRDINNERYKNLKPDEEMVYEKAVYPKFNEIYNLVKVREAWTNSKLDHVVRTAALNQGITNWFSMLKSLKSYFNNKQSYNYNIPGFPHYLIKHNRVINLTIDKTRFRKRGCKNNQICLPKTNIIITIPKNISRSDIRCLTISRFYNYIKIGFVYNKHIKEENHNLDPNSVMGIDPGVKNIFAITINNQNKSWIVKGGRYKSINQYFNKKYAEIKSKLEEVNKKKISKRLQKLSAKRYNILNYNNHCLSKAIISLCLEYKIGKIIIGNNKYWKQETHLGKENTNVEKKNNQNFEYIPHSTLFQYIKYKAEEYGIEVIITEESYTSATDHLMFENMSKQDNNSGERIKRGLYKSGYNGKLLNADCNGAIGILRKLNAISDAQLMCLRNRGDVVSPLILKY